VGNGKKRKKQSSIKTIKRVLKHFVSNPFAAMRYR
jgi:hypothetical protein